MVRMCVMAGGLVVGLAVAGAGQPASTPEPVTLTVKVELSCPSCGAGLVRRLGRLDGVASVEVRGEAGEVVVVAESGRVVPPASVREVVRNAGFLPEGLTIAATGRVETGPPPALVLAADVRLLLANDETTGVILREAAGRQVAVQGPLATPAPPDGETLTLERYEVRE